MNVKKILNDKTIKLVSIITDILFPIILYFSLINNLKGFSWLLFIFVAITRLALVIAN